MAGRHPDKGSARLLSPRTVTRRDALRLLMGTGAVLAAAPRLARADDEFEASEETVAALEAAQARYDEVAAELDRIGQEYADLASQHSKTLDEIERVTKEIEALEQEIERKQREIERKQERLGARMSSAYKSGNQGMLDLLLSATSFDELTSNIYYLDKITAADRDMIESIKADKEALEQDKRNLEEQQKELENLRQQQEDELKALQEKQAEVQNVLNDLDDEVKALIEQRDAEILAAKEEAERLERERQAALAAGTYSGTVTPSAGATGSQSAVIDAASWTPSAGVGFCAAWVTNVFVNAGVGAIYGNACDMYWAYCYTSDLSAIQPGMIIAVPTEPYSYAAILYGHIGIYIGNGLVRHSASGYVITQSLSSWISEYGVTSIPRWGWLGGIVLG